MSDNWGAALEAAHAAVITAFGDGDVFHYLQADGVAFDIAGVFDDAYKRDIVLELGDLGWTTTTPVLGVQLSQFPSEVQQGAFLTREKTGVRYTLVDARPDGHGWAQIILGRAQ